MLLLSSPRSGLHRRASLLLLAAVLLCVVPVSASLPAHARCPHLECARQKRELCQRGSSHCGPCRLPFHGKEEGRCLLIRRHKPDKVMPYPDLDEEIDFLHSVIEKQEVSEVKTPKQQSSHHAAIAFQADVKNSKTDASKQKSLLDESLHTTTAAAPRPAVTALPNTPTPQPRVTAVEGRGGPIAVPAPKKDTVIVILVSLCVVVGTVAVVLASVCYIRLQRESRLAEKVDYPAFRGAGVPPAATANGTTKGDKTLAESAQMYHYQHQKQQMLSMGNHKPEQKALDTEVTSDEEEVGGDFTVYECPGLAPTGEMEVKNPLFDDSNIHYQGNHQ